MRNLTIKRENTFVASLSKMNIYIEDPTSNEIKINNIPCRKLGTLKNGEEKTFQVDDNTAKVFVIADKLSKDYCNEFYQIPEGQFDICLSGKNKFNLLTGNAFRFYSNENREVLENNKKNSKKGLIVLIISSLIGYLIGLGAIIIGLGAINLILSHTSSKPQNKDFSLNGINITLPNYFSEGDYEKYTSVFESKNVAVFALKEEFSLSEGFENLTIDEYMDLVIEYNGLDGVKNKDGNLDYIIYDRVEPESNKSYKFFAYCFKTSDAFWLVQFGTESEKSAKYENQIKTWANSISFN